MLRSLVGSEMCIRDRCPIPENDGQAPGPMLAAPGLGCWQLSPHGEPGQKKPMCGPFQDRVMVPGGEAVEESVECSRTGEEGAHGCGVGATTGVDLALLRGVKRTSVKRRHGLNQPVGYFIRPTSSALMRFGDKPSSALTRNLLASVQRLNGVPQSQRLPDQLTATSQRLGLDTSKGSQKPAGMVGEPGRWHLRAGSQPMRKLQSTGRRIPGKDSITSSMHHLSLLASLAQNPLSTKSLYL
eukprot:TRINITY_DN24173_c0_g1_i1.p1 TRINITY_DN24173_c0_g1~~TRINITY_DN24173_c0_g1_i1.p1  ORF type:complete len:241 (-),score=29.99 TRINITY_DN24173_c0_g1_i1:54-776(-)